MGFLQPLALLALGAATIPALLHLLQRREPPTVPFPAVRYLAEAERRHSRRLKLRHLLLLLLRTALVAVVVLAAARPVVPVPAGGVHAPTALVLIVDNSLSSGAVPSGRRVLDRLKDEARAVLAEAGASDRLWLMPADGVPRVVARGEAERVLDELTSLPVRLDLTDAVRTAASLLSDVDLPGGVVVVSGLSRRCPPGWPRTGGWWRGGRRPPGAQDDSARADLPPFARTSWSRWAEEWWRGGTGTAAARWRATSRRPAKRWRCPWRACRPAGIRRTWPWRRTSSGWTTRRTWRSARRPPRR
jgi:hypothetical protein